MKTANKLRQICFFLGLGVALFGVLWLFDFGITRFLFYEMGKSSETGRSILTFLASKLIYLQLALTVGCGFVLWKRNGFQAVLVFLGSALLVGGIAIGASKGIQHFVPREAPFVRFERKPLLDHKKDPSFPSDHATAGAVLVLLICKRFRRVALISFALLLVLIVARTACGIHWISDSIGGLWLSTAVFGIGAWLAAQWRKERLNTQERHHRLIELSVSFGATEP